MTKLCIHTGASHLHVEAAMAEAGVLLSGPTGSATTRMADAHQARELLQVRLGFGMLLCHCQLQLLVQSAELLLCVDVP